MSRWQLKNIDITCIYSGLAKFEDNLVSQIKNQDELIKTLKTRLSASEDQDANLVKILNSLRTNEKTRLTELKETKERLQQPKIKIFIFNSSFFLPNHLL